MEKLGLGVGCLLVLDGGLGKKNGSISIFCLVTTPRKRERKKKSKEKKKSENVSSCFDLCGPETSELSMDEDSSIKPMARAKLVLAVGLKVVVASEMPLEVAIILTLLID